MFSSEYLVATYLKDWCFSNKLYFQFKSLRDFQNEERTEIQLTKQLSRHSSIAGPDHLCLVSCTEILVQTIFNNI